MLEARFLTSIREVDPQAWDRLVGDGSPFNEWAFLAACEAGSAVPSEGVQPAHLLLEQEGTLVGAVPLYVKADGRAEFIYDWHWYQLARRLGERYYPKAVGMSPFTPVEGSRLLLDPSQDRAAVIPEVARVLETWAQAVGLRGVHLLFAPEAEAAAFEALGYLRRLTYQPVWHDSGYGDEEGFLARFRSKDRVKIKREVRRAEEQGIRFEARAGEAIEEADWAAMQAFYQRTCLLYGTGSDYLKPSTWERLFATWRHRLVLFVGFRGRERLCASLCVRKGSDLFGRYWGTREDLPSLYFNAAYYQPLRFALAEGVSRFFAGSGNVTYKYARGLDPYPIHSVHRVFDPRLEGILARHLEADREEVAAAIERQRRASKLKG